MPLLKQGRITESFWVHLDDLAPSPKKGAVIIGFARWQAERDQLRAVLASSNLTLGLRLENHQSPMDIAEDLANLDVVTLTFPKYGDGRAYSQARRLRERLGFAGEIWAAGDLLRDQFWFMDRCGIDALEFSDDLAAERAARDWQAAVGEFRHAYQPAVQGPAPIIHLRHHRAAA